MINLKKRETYGNSINLLVATYGIICIILNALTLIQFVDKKVLNDYILMIILISPLFETILTLIILVFIRKLKFKLVFSFLYVLSLIRLWYVLKWLESL